MARYFPLICILIGLAVLNALANIIAQRLYPTLIRDSYRRRVSYNAVAYGVRGGLALILLACFLVLGR